MIILSICLCVFANLVKWAELADNTTVRSFRDYRRFNDGVFYKYNAAWIMITMLVYLMLTI